jgi:hypothetical protein
MRLTGPCGDRGQLNDALSPCIWAGGVQLQERLTTPHARPYDQAAPVQQDLSHSLVFIQQLALNSYRDIKNNFRDIIARQMYSVDLRYQPTGSIRLEPIFHQDSR